MVTERVYMVPRADGRLVVGATVEEQGFDTRITAGGVHELLREAYRTLPDVAELELVEAIAGLRPATPDNMPLIGPGRSTAWCSRPATSATGSCWLPRRQSESSRCWRASEPNGLAEAVAR